MSATMIQSVLTTNACSAIPLPKAEEEASLLFDEFLRIRVPEAAPKEVKRVIKAKRNSVPRPNETFGFPNTGKVRSDSASKDAPVVLSRSFNNLPACGASAQSNSFDEDLDMHPNQGLPRGLEVEENDEAPVAHDLEKERRLHAVAIRLSHVADDLERDYGDRLQGFESQLMGVMRNSASSTYEIFASTLNDIIGQDRNLTEMALVMQLSRRVITRTLSNGGPTVSYFRQFVCDAFSSVIATKGGAEKFVEGKETAPEGHPK